MSYLSNKLSRLQRSIEKRWFNLKRRFFIKKISSHKMQYLSDAEKLAYYAIVSHIIKNPNAFKNFKRNPGYQEVLEHVSKEHGGEYLHIVRQRDDTLFKEALESVLRSDDVGNPIKHFYSEVNIPLSPTTLRYLKVTSDLKGLFGNFFNSVAEIGCGYGGQALVNDQLLNVKQVILFDLPLVNQLIQRYLNSTVLKGAFSVTTINEYLPKKHDLVISNYAFSELPSKLQLVYIHKVLCNSKSGYLTMNSGLLQSNQADKLTVEQMKSYLPSFELLEEEPKTGTDNYIIVWGHNKDFASKHMKPMTH